MDDKERIIRQLPERIVIIPDALSLSGGILYARDREPRDVDLITRFPVNAIPEGSRLKVERLFIEAFGLPVHWCPDPQGATWDWMHLYDLVLVKRPDAGEVERVADDERTRELIYKALRPGQPLTHYKARGEFYEGQEEDIAHHFQADIAQGRIAIQPKWDGIRLHIHRVGRDLKVFTETGRERSVAFPGLADVLPPGHYILDVEAVEYTPDFKAPKPRWVMTWMVHEKEPGTHTVRFFVHDAPFLETDISARPYTERLRAISQLIARVRPNPHYQFRSAADFTLYPKDKEDFLAALAKARNAEASEGAMIKRLPFPYNPTRADTWKYKEQREVDVLVIGWRKMPKPEERPGHLTEAQARERLKHQLAASRTYIFRCAIRHGDAWLPIEADHKLTDSDVHLRWDEDRQEWKGTDDPRLWHMCEPWPHRQAGEYAYGNTYALALDTPPSCGMILTVAPMKITLFEKEDGTWGVSWQHPIAKNVKVGTGVADLKDVLAAFGVERPPNAHFTTVRKIRWIGREVPPRGPENASLAIITDGPGEEDERNERLFSGPSGQFLFQVISDLGYNPERVYYDALFPRRGWKEQEEDPETRVKELIDRLSRLTRLKAILVLSDLAAKHLFGLQVKDAADRVLEFPQLRLPTVVTYHPAMLLRTGREKSEAFPRFKQDILRAIDLAGMHKEFEWGQQRKQRAKALDPDFYPPLDLKTRFVFQVHFRGRSAHGDLRVQITPDILEGWTLAIQRPNAITEPVRDLATAHRLVQDPDLWKLNLKTGEPKARLVRTTIQGKPRTIIRQAAIRAMPKGAEIPADWLHIEGVTEEPDPGEKPPVGATRHYPGVFVIVDRGRAEILARKPWLFEYWFHGDVFSGRYLLRFVPRRQPTTKAEDTILPPGEPEPNPRNPGYWIFMRPKDQTPYVLSPEAVEKEWLPPLGYPALPRHIAARIPKEFRFWEAKNRAEALAMREALVTRFEEIGGPSLAQTRKVIRVRWARPQFVLQRHFWRGQIVIRWGPSTEHYDLRIRMPDGSFKHFVLQGDPRKGTTVAYLKPMQGSTVETPEGKKVDVFAIREPVPLKPGTPANPTKATPAFLETLDWGTATILEDKPDRFKVRLSGRKGDYTLFFAREAPETPLWAATLSEPPRVTTVRIRKADDEKRLVYGEVLVPNEPDAHGDVVSPEEIEEAAHAFMGWYQALDLQHARILSPADARIVESFIAPTDITWPNGHVTPKGSWVMVTKILSDDLWRAIKEGKITGYSINGFAMREKVRSGA